MESGRVGSFNFLQPLREMHARDLRDGWKLLYFNVILMRSHSENKQISADD